MTMTRTLLFAAILGPAAVLGAALFSQYVGGLNPCQMCIWQRWPHGVAIALALIALALAPRRAATVALYLGALALIIGAGIGAFHAGVELGYWEGPTTCSGGRPSRPSSTSPTPTSATRTSAAPPTSTR